MSTICTICEKPIYLKPTARERAAKYGGTEAEYKALFTAHAACIIEKRERETRELIKRMQS